MRGADVSREFYEREVAPLLRGVPHAAAVEMWCDNVDVLSHPWRRIQLRGAYEAWRSAR